MQDYGPGALQQVPGQDDVPTKFGLGAAGCRVDFWKQRHTAFVLDQGPILQLLTSVLDRPLQSLPDFCADRLVS